MMMDAGEGGPSETSYTSTMQSDVTFQIIVVTESSAKRETQSRLYTYMS